MSDDDREKLSDEQTRPDRATPDLVARLRELREQIELAEDAVDGLRLDRIRLIEEALSAGIGPGVVARALEISTQRLAKLRQA